MTKIKNKTINGIISAVFVIALILFIITASIGLPIYFRPFYYSQIDTLGIKEEVMYYSDALELGFTEEQITNEVLKEAYDEVLDYLTVGTEFGTGIFKYSESGKSHFVDCKVLFDLNATVLIISFALVVTIILLAKFKVIKLAKPFGFNLFFFAGCGTLAVFAIVGALAAIDFDTAFTVFHKILFPGKDNWYFDPRHDQIILALPQEFFMGCAILIFVSIIVLTSASIIYGVIDKKKSKLPTLN